MSRWNIYRQTTFTNKEALSTVSGMMSWPAPTYGLFLFFDFKTRAYFFNSKYCTIHYQILSARMHGTGSAPHVIFCNVRILLGQGDGSNRN